MSTLDRGLSVLRLFSGNRWEWTVEAAARELGLSQSTAYQYVRSLVEAGLLSAYATGRYVVGPAIIELDLQTRRRDPLILAARPQMDALASFVGGEDVVLLCRLYKLTVMCVDQRAPVAAELPVSYERGLPMPLHRGAASKVILAHLTPRALRRYHEQLVVKGETSSWTAFRKPLRAIRKAGLSVTHGELDPGRTGVSAPVFGYSGDIIGSIGLVLWRDDLPNGEITAETRAELIAAGEKVSAALRHT